VLKLRLTRTQAFAVAAIIALIVAGLVYFVLSQQAGTPEVAEPENITVIVAARDIAAYETITADALSTSEMNTQAAPAGVITDPQSAIGLVAQMPISAGTAITSAHVGPRTAAQGLTFIIPQGMRAVTVALDPISGVGGFVYPGDRVDVLTTFQQGEVAITKTILQNVEVLAMNEQTTRPAAQTGQPSDQPSGQATEAPAVEQVRSATLAVSPDQAQSLLLSAFKGAVHLALRPREDESMISLTGQSDWALMGMEPPSNGEDEEAAPEMPPMMYPGWGAPGMQQPPAAQPAPAPAAQPQATPREEEPRTIEVIRGTERELVPAD
jgi:pilus assembly protein CpaB